MDGDGKSYKNWLMWLLGGLAATAVAWNYAQLDTIRLASVEIRAMLNGHVEREKLDQARLDVLEARNNAQDQQLATLIANQQAVMKRLDALEVHLQGKPYP